MRKPTAQVQLYERDEADGLEALRQAVHASSAADAIRAVILVVKDAPAVWIDRIRVEVKGIDARKRGAPQVEKPVRGKKKSGGGK